MDIKQMEFLKKCRSRVGFFFGKAAPMIRIVGNEMSYLPGKRVKLEKQLTLLSE
jgi:hypothetical protein